MKRLVHFLLPGVGVVFALVAWSARPSAPDGALSDEKRRPAAGAFFSAAERRIAHAAGERYNVTFTRPCRDRARGR